MTDEPKLLRIPRSFHSVSDVLETAKKMDLCNILVVSETEDGNLIVMDAPALTVSHTNWLIDRVKTWLLMPDSFDRKGP
jgi:hypothetical protein